jgi:hypothetical protein
MEPVVGVFATRQEAEKATEGLSERGLGQITLLTPGDWKEKVHSVRTEDMERPGIGAALCGLVGAGLGAAAGLAFTLELPGALTLGLGGAAAGIAVGQAIERSLCDGLPKDDLYRYMDAMRQGCSVVIAFTNKTQSAAAARDVMTGAGAQNLVSARRWRWFGPRPAEEKPDRAEA